MGVWGEVAPSSPGSRSPICLGVALDNRIPPRVTEVLLSSSWPNPGALLAMGAVPLGHPWV